MKVIFFGLGSIGQRQARILLENFGYELIAFRSGKNCGRNDLGIKEVFDFEEIARLGPEVAFVTNPTYLHIKTALQCANMGMHLFIEKPLSHSFDGIDELAAVCQKKGLTCYVAYGLRFHPVIKKLKELTAGKKINHARAVSSSYLPEWRREGGDYSSYTGQGGGVLLELSHEFDYVQYLLGQIVKMSGVFGKRSGVTVDAEDYADGLLILDGALPVNLHLNLASRLLERYLKIDFEGGYLLGDLINCQIRHCQDGKVEILQFDFSRDNYLKEQAEYFFNNLGNPKIMNSIAEARQLLGRILEFKNAKR